MISQRLLLKLLEIYQEFGLKDLKSEIRERALHTYLDCPVQSIVNLVLEAQAEFEETEEMKHA